MLKWVLVTAVLLLAWPSYAATVPWYEQQQGGTQRAADSVSVGSVGTVQVARPGSFYIYRPSSANETSDNSSVIDVRACGGSSPTIQFWPDTAGSNYSAQGFVYACPTATWSAASCVKILLDLDGGGVDNTALDGDAGDNRDALGGTTQTQWQTGISFPFIAFHHTANSTIANTSETSGNIQVGLYCATP